jgi:hypothetical protein
MGQKKCTVRQYLLKMLFMTTIPAVITISPNMNNIEPTKKIAA